ncbi:Benzyl alcohol O-benzoyltransferase, partial [Bienertia sinuspersici]
YASRAKLLSDIDDQGAHSFQIPANVFYQAHPSMDGKNLIKVVKDDLAKALVLIYPYVVDLSNGRTGNLLLIVQGKVCLSLRPMLMLPLRISEMRSTLNFLLRTCYMTFLVLMGCLALPCSYVRRNEEKLLTPLVVPVWDRERLVANKTPKVTFSHPEYDQHKDDHDNSHETREPELVRLLFAINARNKFNSPLAKGFYGNACAIAAVCAKVGDICKNKVEYIVDLITSAKSKVNEDYMKSIMKLMVKRDRPRSTLRSTYIISDLRHLGFADVNFWWGEAYFRGPANNGSIPNTTFFISFKNKNVENMIMVPISLKPKVIEVFVKEL